MIRKSKNVNKKTLAILNPPAIYKNEKILTRYCNQLSINSLGVAYNILEIEL